jgi:hypothetical protein
MVRAIAAGVVRAAAMGALPMIGTAGALALAGSASAEVKPVPPHYVVVAKDNAALRCADGPIYYPVRMLKTGDVLRVDGEGNGWMRAEYPTGTRAYVKQDEGTFDAATKTLKLVKATRMMAANDAGARRAREVGGWVGGGIPGACAGGGARVCSRGACSRGDGGGIGEVRGGRGCGRACGQAGGDEAGSEADGDCGETG